MLANNIFAIIEEKVIKIAKFMTKKQVCLLIQTPIKLNGIWIQFISNKNIMLNQKTWIRGILLIKNYKVFTTNSKKVVCTNLSLKK